MPHRHVVIYLPTGKQIEYTTKDLGSQSIEVAETIVCEHGEVNVVVKIDNKAEGYAYVGMPYVLNIWD